MTDAVLAAFAKREYQRELVKVALLDTTMNRVMLDVASAIAEHAELVTNEVVVPVTALQAVCNPPAWGLRWLRDAGYVAAYKGASRGPDGGFRWRVTLSARWLRAASEHHPIRKWIAQQGCW
ncbi:hypothetical protein [Bradyrhizobium elkanii]|uniref:hypothetical protein n=1 Tax=Bradyrhizobium elkanii TaxID=29448 RepID=UPI0003AA433F|nr:hypothetical protein [Bradyrhizobium elkanii]MBP2434766.1 hypothetical protein [Bradyrhizobium elkanii]MCP1731998.1 hypothetical protein [Bradyrhizobium elkanii]MCS3567332.1 hypothetical protein [Bradyrhizobium elkanii]MCS3591183.1 hypothetical protein [Bradyrhizobium elkanii]MCS3620626.1 hypothetical protein [Bradyrhizobium elkanii]